MSSKFFLGAGLAAALLLSVPVSFAEAPVVDVSQDNSVQSDSVQTTTTQALGTASVPEPSTKVTLPDQSPLSESQRLTRLEQQIDNLTAMNLPQQISDLQQSLAQLRGQLQVQAHDLKMLNDQQRSFYQDLDQRINQLKNLNSGNGSDNNSNSDTKKSDTNNSSSNVDIHLKDSNAYQSAFSLLEKKQYDKSQAAFEEYLNDYPNGQYVSNAHYWMGEIYLAQKNYAKAETEFKTVITKFPKSAKLADAKLKIAIIHADSGKVDLARREFMQIKKEHPGSTAAQLASIRLQQLNAASHVPSNTDNAPSS